MNKPVMDQVTLQDGESANLVNENIERLKAIFPEAFGEGGINFDTLRQLLGDAKVVDEGEEKYGLNWHGKKKARQIALTPSTGTLLPCPDESVDWDNTQNLFIEGDNLEVLKLLQKSYAGKVKMIYIDPPYNTEKDFVYPDRYAEGLETYLQYTGQKSDTGDWNVSDSGRERTGRKHTSWLSMMYPRLMLSRALLSDDGMIFISIDDNEADNLKKICSEIFGEENFVAQFIWNTDGHTDNQYDVKVNHEYILLYCKNKATTSLGHVIDPNTREESNLWKGFAENSITKNGPANPPSEITLPIGFPCEVESLNLEANSPDESFYQKAKSTGYITRDLTDEYSLTYPVRKDTMRISSGTLQAPCRVYAGWANADKLRSFIKGGCVEMDENGDKLKFYLSKNGVIYYRRERDKARNILSVLRGLGTTEKMRSELESQGLYYKYPKPKEMIEYLIKVSGIEDGIVLDFFAGSGTTAHAALNANNNGLSIRYILVQLPELLNPAIPDQVPSIQFLKSINKPQNLAEITKERLRRTCSQAGFKCFKLSNSNLKIWNPDRSDLEETLLSHQEHLIEGRSEQDILFELLLKRGIDLAAPIDSKKVSGKNIYSIGYGALFACLDDSPLAPAEVEDIAQGILKWHEELKPASDTYVFFRDSMFSNDVAKTNMAAILEQNGISHVRSL
ncbi:TPA: site-specific DNA-methyltransferase [Pseudomonas aeruginosa]|nr:site-specific DNA-methyltransferase [Pseudomonas aeruginosa]